MGRQLAEMQCEASGSSCKPAVGKRIIWERSKGIVERVVEFLACELLPARVRSVLTLDPVLRAPLRTLSFEATSLAYQEFGFCAIWVTSTSAVTRGLTRRSPFKTRQTKGFHLAEDCRARDGWHRGVKVHRRRWRNHNGRHQPMRRMWVLASARINSPKPPSPRGNASKVRSRSRCVANYRESTSHVSGRASSSRFSP